MVEVAIPENSESPFMSCEQLGGQRQLTENKLDFRSFILWSLGEVSQKARFFTHPAEGKISVVSACDFGDSK